jgi:hypothetical protein
LASLAAVSLIEIIITLLPRKLENPVPGWRHFDHTNWVGVFPGSLGGLGVLDLLKEVGLKEI